MILPQSSLANISANAQPCEGPKMLPYIISLTTANPFEIDLTTLYQDNSLSGAQSIFIDNTLNTAVLSLELSSQQILKIPPGAQGYVRLLSPNPPKITGSSAGTATIRLFVLNFPTETALWFQNGFLFTFNGASELLVSDPSLRAAVSGNYFQCQNALMATAQTVVPYFGGSTIYCLDKATINDTAMAAALGLGLGYFVKEISVMLSGNASLAVAGVVTVAVREAAVVIAQRTVYLPAAAPNTPGGFEVIKLRNLNYTMKTANVALNAFLSVALATGTASFCVVGGTTNQIGP